MALLVSCASWTRIEYAPVDLQPSGMVAPFETTAGLEASADWVAPSPSHAGKVGETIGTSTEIPFIDPPDPARMEIEPLPRLLPGDRKTYTRAMLGAFYGAGDLNNQNTGYWAELAVGRKVLPFLSFETTLGYIQSDGPILDVWTLPLMIQGRVQLPLLIFEVYGGLGLGGAYVDGSSAAASPSGFAWAGQAFLGAEVGLGNLALGLEGRYFATTEVDNILTVEGSSLMLLVKLPF